MTSYKDQLKSIIEDIINAKEKEFDHRLEPKSLDFLIKVCTDFVNDNIHKFVAGDAEHGGDFLNDISHRHELYKELLDAVNYLKAMEYK